MFSRAKSHPLLRGGPRKEKHATFGPFRAKHQRFYGRAALCPGRVRGGPARTVKHDGFGPEVQNPSRIPTGSALGWPGRGRRVGGRARKTRGFRPAEGLAPWQNQVFEPETSVFSWCRAPRFRTARRRGVREGGSSWTAKTRGFLAVVFAAREKPWFSDRQTPPKTRAFRLVGGRHQTARENTALPGRAGRRSRGNAGF